MNMTIEEFIPLPEIRARSQEKSIMRGDPDRLIKNCENLSWKKPARLWTFRTESEPPADKLSAFMDKFEKVFHVHERDGDYMAAWWSTSKKNGNQFTFKGLFADLNPETGPDFFKRAADGPRIAIWFGRIHEGLLSEGRLLS